MSRSMQRTTIPVSAYHTLASFALIFTDVDFTGTTQETGSNEGLGYNFNIPLPQGTGDEQYLKALDEAKTHVHEFSPDYLVVR